MISANAVLVKKNDRINSLFFGRPSYKFLQKVFTSYQECGIISLRRKLNNTTLPGVTWDKYTFFLLAKMYAPFLYAFPCYMVVLKSLRRGMELRFSVRSFGCAPFFMLTGGYMSKNIPKRIRDITGTEFSPGKPGVCLGNGAQGFACCCDECDHYLLCFPEFDQANKDETIVENNACIGRSYKKDEEF